MFWIDVVSRVLHVATAIVLIGGSVFSLFVVSPAATAFDKDAQNRILSEIGSRWKRFVHLGVLVFLASGLYNYFRLAPMHKGDGLYHALVGTKMILALFVFFVASALVGRSEKLAAFRNNREKWLRIVVILAAVIVTMSGFVKVRGVPAVDAVSAQESSSE